MALSKIKVLIVDDSAIVRKIFKEEISKETDLEVVGTAPDPFVARDKIVYLKPDVITLDIEMPRMDGLTFLKNLMQFYPLPVIIVSSLTPQGSRLALEAMEYGAVDVQAKPDSSRPVMEISAQLKEKIRAAARVNWQCLRRPPVVPSAPPSDPGWEPREGSQKIIVIGASTGGTEAIKWVLMNLPANVPGAVIVQHMPAQFTRAFAERLNRIGPLEVKEAEEGDRIRSGRALIAPGNFHILLKTIKEEYQVIIRDGPQVHHQRPSIDVFFHSVAQQAGTRALGILLTGMGVDGAQGLLEMRQAGAKTIAEDESTCVVFGMPKEAIRLGAADRTTPLDRIPQEVMRLLKYS